MKAIDRGQIDRLCKILRVFSVDHRIAKSLLDEFREIQDLGVAKLDGTTADPNQLCLPLPG